MYKKPSKIGVIISFLSLPLLAQGELVFQFDANDREGVSTLDTQFPDAPAVTATQRTPSDPVNFSPDVPNVHGGGFSVASRNGTPAGNVALSFDYGEDMFANATEFTMAAWLKPDINGTSAMRSFSHTGSLFHERLSATRSRLRFGAGVNMDGTLALPLGVWTYAAITYDGSEATFYSRTEDEDNFTVNTVDVVDGQTPGAAADVIWFSHPGNSNAAWDGLMDNMRLYTRALTEEELNDTYAYADVTIPESSIYPIVLCIFTLAFVTLRKRKNNIV